jgi:hypothetical protein
LLSQKDYNMTTNTDETNSASRPVTDIADDIAKEELRTVNPQLEAARAALVEVQRALEPLKEWRASELWETVEAALEVLDLGRYHALEYPTKPKHFRHWREKYVTDKDAAPF